ncbi:uncharacterized protein LOC124672579 isoform X5 [Lolium rigidum]|uniref:uncharacterized protein LOC124672579 isoform X5 n=1 Tax=Lolium rigidum TaxID=89674 RepID=UPI001F5D1ED0|nr:uncharacterized protein LOC124672579 isoform X5 [Lolium rigidum]
MSVASNAMVSLMLAKVVTPPPTCTNRAYVFPWVKTIIQTNHELTIRDYLEEQDRNQAGGAHGEVSEEKARINCAIEESIKSTQSIATTKAAPPSKGRRKIILACHPIVLL